MPETRTVTLNYDQNNASAPFGPSPREVKVKPNDTIQFTLGAGTRAAHAGCKLRITLHREQHFSRRVLQHTAAQTGAEPLTLAVRPGLQSALAAILGQPSRSITGYRCELLDAGGQPIPGLVADGATGGEIVPDTGTGS